MRRMRTGLAVILALCAAISACSSKPRAYRDDHVFIPPLGPYGWSSTFPAGTKLTDGGPILEISAGPIRIVSIEVKQSGTSPQILGIYVRRLIPAHPFTGALGFPPTDSADWDGAQPAVGAVLGGPQPGSAHADYEILVGYQMPPAGHYHSDGLVITYEYQGHRSTITHPSEVDLCVGRGPDNPSCDPPSTDG